MPSAASILDVRIEQLTEQETKVLDILKRRGSSTHAGFIKWVDNAKRASAEQVDLDVEQLQRFKADYLRQKQLTEKMAIELKQMQDKFHQAQSVLAEQEKVEQRLAEESAMVEANNSQLNKVN